MTIHTDVQAAIEKDDFLPQGLIKSSGIPLFPDDNRAIVILVSIMTMMYSLFPSKQKPDEQEPLANGKGNAYTVTFDQLYERFRQRLRRELGGSHRVYACVLAADTSGGHYKLTSAGRKGQPYPPGSKLTRQGVVFQNQVSDIQMQRLMHTRSMRQDLVRLLMEMIQQDDELASFRIICDMSATEPPVMFYDGQTTSLPRLQNKLVEDDLKIPWIAMEFSDCHIFCQSKDRDMWYLFLLHAKRFQGMVVCSFGDGRFVIIDENVRQLEQAGWTVDGFVQSVILCGTDWFLKKCVANQLSVSVMLTAAFAVLKHGFCRNLTSRADFERFLKLAYCFKLKLGVMPASETLAKTCREQDYQRYRLHWPDDKVLEAGFKRFMWNVNYWTTLDGILDNRVDDWISTWQHKDGVCLCHLAF